MLKTRAGERLQDVVGLGVVLIVACSAQWWGALLGA